MAPTRPIRCRCGKFHAELADPLHSTRIVCYCRDCQAYAYFLGPPPHMLDALGGTDIIAVASRQITVTQGVEHLGCMSLSTRGPYRWYTRCCGTPIGNTSRDVKQSHVGLVHSCLGSSNEPLDPAFGPVRLRVFRDGAQGQAEANRPLTFFLGALRHLGFMTWSRISGKYKINPFFDAVTGQPIVTPRELTPSELDDLKRRVGRN